MRSFIYGMLTTLLLIFSAPAQADIHRCTDAEGSIIFQQLPCAEPEPEPEADQEETETEAQAPTNEVDAVPAVAVARVELRSPELVAQCKKKYRDAIDVIDAEMREQYTPEQADEYKKRLLVLTEQLRAC